jgi:PAT family beta-lactamase induction signal transducer AmpG
LPEWKQDPSDLQKWWIIFAISAVAFWPAVMVTKRAIRGTPLAESFASYVRQRGFWAIFLFILVYRFGEAMVTRWLALFFKDSPAVGGLGISTAQYGLINGFAGVWGIIVGGLIGGVVVARLGLRRSFWPLAICMHAPNLLYLWIAFAYKHYDDPNHWQNLPFLLDWPLYIAVFIHEFAYGFGFAAYFVFLMDVAQRGNFKTSHYAIGTGLGALCGTLAGITCGILLASMSYVGFFIAVCILSVPGLMCLLLIPLGPPAEPRGFAVVGASH